MVSYF